MPIHSLELTTLKKQYRFRSEELYFKYFKKSNQIKLGEHENRSDIKILTYIKYINYNTLNTLEFVHYIIQGIQLSE